MANNREILSAQVPVVLSLSDWLTLLGWSSAHVNESTPNLIVGTIREISSQVLNG